MLQELFETWDGEMVATRYERDAGVWMFVCVHSTQLGPGTGGTRMKSYASPYDALRDGMRLSGAMTLKFAVVGLPLGGGKAVIAIPEIPQGDERVALMRRYGEFVGSLGGTYRTAPDMNTSERDMDIVGDVCGYAFCRSPERGGSGNTAPATATGVFHAVRASLAHATGSDDLGDRIVTVQGAGAVGARLAELLVAAGARVRVADVDQTRAEAAASASGAVAVPSDDVLHEECDVFAPCAIGGVLDERSIPRLRCRVVAGAANNQLATPADARRLHEAGILWAPDFVANAGGVLHGGGFEVLGWGPEEVERSLEGIGDTLRDVFERAERDGVTTLDAAERLAHERLAAASASAGRGPSA
ncbi:MAG TPA: Glu/Leu/Phe/Val dehydrogenase dimerization domain-containing protein [Actinomycetota bacterium]|nr:Glu/Leu/Phe/Val dehydrogenase dimerization domain-containing protein [Actinomycetota bacterium]